MARQDIGYDYEDFGQTAAWLEAKYGHEHPEFTRDIYEEGQTMPYWEWVVDGIKGDDESIPGNDANGNPIESQPEPAPVKNPQTIEDMDQLVLLFAKWHKQANMKCQNMFDMPEGHAVELVLKEGDPPIEMVLEGEKYQAFRMGIMAAVECFGPLPFTYSVEDAADVPDESPGQ